MRSRSEAVRTYFDKTHLYLGNNASIGIRSIVVKNMIGDLHDASILDVGCGDGTISLQFLSETNQITLLDMSPNMLKIAYKNTPDGYRCQVDYLNQQFSEYKSDHQYDVILCLGLLPHVDSIESTISKVSRLLKVGGKVVFQITDHDTLIGKSIGSYYSFHRKIFGRDRHQMNPTYYSKILPIALQWHLVLVDTRRFMSLIPGMGKLPKAWLFRFGLLTLNTPMLARYGSEAIMIFKKQHDSSISLARSGNE